MRRWPFKLLAAGALCACVAAIGLAVFGGSLLRAAVAFGGNRFGYGIGYDRLDLRPGRLSIVHPDVSGLKSEPLFSAQKIDVAYSLRDLFGSAHPFGISSLEIDRPKITLIHHKDGSYNFTLPARNPNAPVKPFSLPQLRLVVKDGSVGLLDETRIFRHSRRLALENVQISADLDPRARSWFHFGLAVHEDGGAFPVAGHGTLDEPRGYELSHVTIPTLALAPLLDYALNSTSLYISGGVLNRIDARFYGLRDKAGAMARHLSVSADLDHFQPYLNGIAKPLRDGRGSLRVYDDGLAIPKLDGSIAGIPVRIAGGIYDLARPELRLGIAGNGDLARLLTLNDAAKTLPASGPLAFRLFVEGAATSPTTFASFAGRRIFYNRVPIDGARGLVALGGTDTSILSTRLAYDGIQVGARGNLSTVRKQTTLDVFADVAAAVARLPFGRALLGDMLVRTDAVVAGPLGGPRNSGVIEGASPGRHLAGTFSVDGSGMGDIGPLALDGPQASALYARVALDRPRGGGGSAVVSVHDLKLDAHAAQPVLPGIALPALPRARGTIDASLAGSFAGKRFALGGSVQMRGADVLGYPIDDLSARFAARDPRKLAFDGRYRGDLGSLSRAVGGNVRATGIADVRARGYLALGATGSVGGLAPSQSKTEFGLPAAGSRATPLGSRATALVAIDARFDHASLAGASLGALNATIGLHGSDVNVYGARAQFAGHAIVAQGSFGNGGVLDVSTSGLNLALLRAAGLPVRSGTASALATIGGTFESPVVAAGIAASGVRGSDSRISDLSLDASTGLQFSADTLRVQDGSLTVGPALGEFEGSVAGLRRDPRVASYAFGLHLVQADIGTLGRILRAPLHPEGTLEADLHVVGSGSSPELSGRVAIPGGSLNGLAYRNASVELNGDARAVHARAGRVTVGSSVLAFGGDFGARAQKIDVRAPQLELSDFNDFFDRGDTLGGSGSASATVVNSRDRFVLTSDARFAHTRFRSFDIGDTRANVSTTGRAIAADVSLGSTSGRLTLRGDATFARNEPLRDPLRRTALALETRADDVALGVWLPAAGIVAPVTGKVNADATIRGTYPDVVAVAHAQLDGGTAGRIAIRKLAIDARAAGGRVTVGSAVLAIDNAQATASGSLGLKPHGPVDAGAVVRVADIGALAKTITGRSYDASGALTTTLHVTGTPEQPLVSGVFDGERVRYASYTIPHARAAVALTSTHVNLQSAEVDLNGGRLLATGAAPLRLNPLGIGPATAPIALRLSAEGIDIAQFGAFFPKGTQAAGLLNGGAALVGTLAKPGLSGTLALSNGSFVGPQLKSKVTDAVARVTLSGTTATLHDTSAAVGGGTLSASGNLTVPSLRRPARDASGSLQVTLDNPVLDAPQYFRGRVDGNLTVTRAVDSPLDVGGKLAFSSTRIPLSAVFNPNAPKASTSAAPLPVAFDLDVGVDRDVRLQGGPADVGATGNLHVGGTLAAPTAQGRLETVGGGTISFYRTFRVQDGSTLDFDPSDGVVPTVDVNATTTVPNPQTDVSLAVTGLATKLNVALTSSPSYDQSQILGLLVGAQALGAVSGVASTSGGAQQNPFQSLASGELGTLLTQNILQPFGSQLGGAIGLSDLALNYAPGSGIDVGAKKKLFKNVNAVFAQTFSYPQRQSIGLQATNSANTTAAQVTFFTQTATSEFASIQPQTFFSSNQVVTAAQPTNGDEGLSFSLQRKF